MGTQESEILPKKFTRDIFKLALHFFHFCEYKLISKTSPKYWEHVKNIICLHNWHITNFTRMPLHKRRMKCSQPKGVGTCYQLPLGCFSFHCMVSPSNISCIQKYSLSEWSNQKSMFLLASNCFAERLKSVAQKVKIFWHFFPHMIIIPSTTLMFPIQSESAVEVQNSCNYVQNIYSTMPALSSFRFSVAYQPSNTWISRHAIALTQDYNCIAILWH